MRELKEDFERWWVTATFEEKVSMALIGAMIVQALLLPIATVFSRGKKTA